MEQFLQYAPLILVVLAYLYQNNIFTKPVDLEKTKAEILEKVESKFVTLQLFNEVKGQVSEMKEKIDKIYDCLMNKDC